jgi:hypothetical protein
MKHKQFIFIIGSERSGTTWLQSMIGAHPLVCTTVELTLYNRYTAPWIKAWREQSANLGRWHQGLPFLWSEDEFYFFLRQFLERVYARVLVNNPQATHILDKCPGYSEYVEDINRLFPTARFIHVIRDGRDVVVSMVAGREQMGFGTATIEDSAVAWKKHVRGGQKAGQYRGRYMEVRYEDISASGVNVLKGIFEFCGLPTSVEEATRIAEAHEFEKMKASKITPARNVRAPEGHYRRGKVGSWRDELDLLQRYDFDKIAGDLLCELGYAEDGWWADSSKQRFALPVLTAISSVVNRIRHATAILLGPCLTRYIRAARSR